VPIQDIILAAEEALSIYAKLRALAAAGGATPEQLAALDAKLSDAIAARKAEQV
jgi:hypothetical protein